MNVRLVEVLRRDLAAIQEDLDNLTVESQVRIGVCLCSCGAFGHAEASCAAF